jgi:LysR family transcriptional regulator, nitrogen assimilation regulatory protein
LSHLAMEAIGLIETAVLPLYTADRNPGVMQG